MRVLIREGNQSGVVHQRWLKQLAAFTVQEVKGISFEHKAELSIVLTHDAEVKKLNRIYRKKNKTTDVLSFSLLEGEVFHKGWREEVAMGDVVISVPQARRQALRHGRSFKAELALLMVHGILHLLGFDHVTLAQEKKMFALQDSILKKFGS